MNRFRWIIWLGGGLLGYVAAELMLKDAWLRQSLGGTLPFVARIAPLTLGTIIALFGWRLDRRENARRNFSK